MPAWLERYQQGECEQVWREMLALGDAIRQEPHYSDARAVAYETSEVRPQVNGLIRRRLFAEGGFVRAGQPLYQIDASLYQAGVDQAVANLASARASAQAADERARRLEPLAKMQAVAEQDYTDALAQARMARAAVAQNGAALETARIMSLVQKRLGSVHRNT